MDWTLKNVFAAGKSSGEKKQKENMFLRFFISLILGLTSLTVTLKFGISHVLTGQNVIVLFVKFFINLK